MALVDRWIFSRLAQTIAQVNDALEHFRFHEAAHVVYHFFWGDFCDWYIEWVKPAISDAAISPDAAADREMRRRNAWRNLFAVFEARLRLLHPFMPFLTEELWHQLPQRPGARSIALERFPEAASRSWRGRRGRPPGRASAGNDRRRAQHSRGNEARPEAPRGRRLSPAADAAVRALVESNRDVVLRLASLSEFAYVGGSPRSARGTRARHLRNLTCASLTATLWTRRLSWRACAKKKNGSRATSTPRKNRLADQTFRSRAPAEIVRQLEATFAERHVEFDKVSERLAQLEKTADASPSP